MLWLCRNTIDKLKSVEVDLPANEFNHGHGWIYVSNWANFRDFLGKVGG